MNSICHQDVSGLSLWAQLGLTLPGPVTLLNQQVAHNQRYVRGGQQLRAGCCRRRHTGNAEAHPGPDGSQIDFQTGR
jgi:hypothetical protein